MDTTLLSILVSAVVSVAISLINRWNTQHQIQQTQAKDILTERIRLYPKLWHIHILYETNWVLEKKLKTREWAENYVAALNEFNLEGGIFFSESVYTKFAELRSLLYDAISTTPPNGTVKETLADEIRASVYGRNGQPGLSTHLKDDLGSYRTGALQRRTRA